MKLLILTAAFYDRDYDQKLERLTYCCEALGIDLLTYGKGEFFSFYDSKIVQMAKLLTDVKDKYTHVLYTDAADSLIFSSVSEIIQKYREFKHPLVTSAEKGCHPFGHLADKFPPSPTPFRFMNPGNFIGEINYVIKTLAALIPFSHMQTDDQGHWHEGFLQGKIDVALDHNCELFQCMSDCDFKQEFTLMPNGRIQNDLTRSEPCIVHFNGPKGEGTYNDKNMRTTFEFFKKHHEII